jgi:spore coat polysaccharide biosynthesis predicted glycosyltransferase SpsG
MIQATKATFVSTSSDGNDFANHGFSRRHLFPKIGLLLDSYTLSTRDLLLARTRFADIRIVLLDDFGDRAEYVCDAFINFTISAGCCKYPANIESYLGLQYFPARSWLRQAKAARKLARVDCTINNPIKWLVACGGTDFFNVTERLVDTLATCLPDSEVCVLLANNVDSVRLERKLSNFHKYQIIQPSIDLKDAFIWADACVCGGGFTKYECIFAGIPVASFAQTIEQQSDTNRLVHCGMMLDLGPAYHAPDHLPIDAFNICFGRESNFSYRNFSEHVFLGAYKLKTVLLPFSHNLKRPLYEH